MIQSNYLVTKIIIASKIKKKCSDIEEKIQIHYRKSACLGTQYASQQLALVSQQTTTAY